MDNKWLGFIEVKLYQELQRQQEIEAFEIFGRYIKQLREKPVNTTPYMENEIKYRTPKYEEFIVGFEFESNYWYFSKDGEWTNSIITEDNLDDTRELWRNDAYSTEFRVKC